MHFTRQFINVSLDGNRTYRAMDAFIHIPFKELIGIPTINAQKASTRRLYSTCEQIHIN